MARLIQYVSDLHLELDGPDSQFIPQILEPVAPLDGNYQKVDIS